ncbi:MAG: hypothetical protein LBF57_04025 [Holosporaceae bacterium]|jgi:hypothetical protein|nr:hypothetical protein [Holosporaceae bacterium]
MKSDFKNLSEIKKGSVFYLYGNYKKSFEIFCEYVGYKLSSLEMEVHFCTFFECLRIINGQCNLFDTRTNCFYIKNIEDNCLEKIQPLLDSNRDIFILESGNYLKSKKITDFCLSSDKVIALPSFNNDLTLQSLCKMFFPNLSPEIRNEIIKIANHTDEEIYSIFKKISFLENFETLKDYSTYKKAFLDDFDTIPLIRFLSQMVIKERIFEKSSSLLGIKFSNKEILNDLLTLELNQKRGFDIIKSQIYWKCQT